MLFLCISQVAAVHHDMFFILACYADKTSSPVSSWEVEATLRKQDGDGRIAIFHDLRMRTSEETPSKFFFQGSRFVLDAKYSVLTFC